MPYWAWCTLVAAGSLLMLAAFFGVVWWFGEAEHRGRHRE